MMLSSAASMAAIGAMQYTPQGQEIQRNANEAITQLVTPLNVAPISQNNTAGIAPEVQDTHVLENPNIAIPFNPYLEARKKAVDVDVPSGKWGEAVQHAQDEGTTTITIDRRGAESRRKASLKGVPVVPGKDRDEWPPAVSKEGGSGASVRHISPTDNRGFGSFLGRVIKKLGLPDGTKVRLRFPKEEKAE